MTFVWSADQINDHWTGWKTRQYYYFRSSYHEKSTNLQAHKWWQVNNKIVHLRVTVINLQKKNNTMKLNNNHSTLPSYSCFNNTSGAIYAGVPTVDFGCEWSTEDWANHTIKQICEKKKTQTNTTTNNSSIYCCKIHYYIEKWKCSAKRKLNQWNKRMAAKFKEHNTSFNFNVLENTRQIYNTT